MCVHKQLTLSQQKHLDIIRAAKKEFIEYGFSGENMARITFSSGVSKRTLYRHFESKSVLFESVLIVINDSVSKNELYRFDLMRLKALSYSLMRLSIKKLR